MDLNWTEKPPTVEGTYIFKKNGEWPLHLHRIAKGDWRYTQNPEWLYAGDKELTGLGSGWWLGPIPFPNSVESQTGKGAKS
jgi:hypothetical protein